MTMTNMVSGFRSTGVYPLNRNALLPAGELFVRLHCPNMSGLEKLVALGQAASRVETELLKLVRGKLPGVAVSKKEIIEELTGASARANEKVKKAIKEVNDEQNINMKDLAFKVAYTKDQRNEAAHPHLKIDQLE